MSSKAPAVEPLRWTPASIVLIGSASALIAASLALPSPVLLFLAFPLLLAPVVALAQTPRTAAPTRLAWTSEGSTSEVRIQGIVEPPAGVVLPSLDLTFYRPEPITEAAPPRLTRGTTVLEFVLDWRAPHPCLVTVPRPDIVWRDSLGVLERRLAVDGASLRVERFPPELTRIGTVRLRRTAPVPGEVRSRALGPTGEFFAIRQAASGDTYRQINWWASARSGRLLANDFLRERTGDILLLLDLRPSPLGERLDRTMLAISAAAATGIAAGFLSEKSRVGLGLFDEFLTAVPLASGRLQKYRIQRALEKVRLAENPGPSERLAVSLPRYFPPGTTTILLSPLADDEPLLLLTHLRRRGYPAVVLSPSPLPLLTGEGTARAADDELVLRLLALVRRLRVSRAWREAPVVEWPDYWSLAPLVRYLKAPPRNVRGVS